MNYSENFFTVCSRLWKISRKKSSFKLCSAFFLRLYAGIKTLLDSGEGICLGLKLIFSVERIEQVPAS
jgi:hypothetical protein